MSAATRQFAQKKISSGKTKPDVVTTLQMVAAEAGVSPSTVSRIINGTASVSDARRSAVEQAIAKLKFQPNPTARGLATGRSMTIGVVTQAIDSPYYSEGLRGIETYLQAHGYAPLFMSGNWNAQDEARCLSQLIARRVDGIIFFAGCLNNKELADHAKRLPIVVTGRSLKARGLLSLKIDDHAGAMMATRHLLELGHRKIAFIGGPADHIDALERFEGYKQVLAENKIAFDPKLVAEGDFREAGGEAATHRLLDGGAKFSALFCANDQMTHGVYLALSQRGVNVPGDVSVVGFDDLSASAYMLPPLTTIRQSVLALGQCSAQAVLQLINGQRARISLPPVELIVRKSTQPFKGE